MRRATALALLAILAGSPRAANAVIQTALPQLLFIPNPAPAPAAPAPLPPPINPGYAATPSNGLSPLLTEPGPFYQLSQPPSPAYPPPQLPGPIDQQKKQSYRNDLRGRQWQLQSQGVSPDSTRSREIEQQLNAPDPQ
ncbi:MAG TPA: hypothetical protein VNV39_23415 [Stellaceae bacterium]|jgi:hypothetical protein|nr:hypothetical protein [Stellaceae bacterium]